MNADKEIRSTRKLIFLHLFPGIALCIMYIFFSKADILVRYPKIVILGISTIFSTIPIELGYLFYVAKKEEDTFNLFKVIGFKGKLKVKALIGYVLLLIIVGGILLTALKPLSNYLLETVFDWIPSWFIFDQDLSLFGKKYIFLAVLVSFFIMALLVPIIEELYFRGFMLARMKWMGKYSVLFNAILFAVYHFYSPWLILTKIAIMLPLCYFVYKKDSIQLGILVHCLAQLADVIFYVTLLI